MKLHYIKLFVPLLVILLGVFVYVSKQDAKSGDKIVPLAERYHVTSGDIANIEYTSAAGTMRAVNADGRWQMSQPGDFPADSGIVTAFIDNLLSIKPDRILTDLPPDKLAEYGLDAPTATIQLSDAKQVLLNLKLGTRNAAGSSYYAQVANDGAILTLPVVQLEESILNQEPNSFRSKNVFSLDREKLARIEVRYPGEGRGYTIEKQTDGWQITSPFVYRAKERLIDATLVHLEDLDVLKFTPTPRDQAATDPALGLATPQAIIALVDAEGARQELSLGAAGTELTSMYAVSSELPEVILTEQFIADRVIWNDKEIKEDRLVIFATDSIGTIEVRLRGADNLVLNRTPTGTWHRSQPTSNDFGPDEITPLIKALIDLAPSDYIPAAEAALLDEEDFGFSEYTLKVELKKSDTFKSQILTIGKLHRKRGFFTSDSLSDGVYLLPESLVNALDKEVESIRGGDASDDEQEAWTAEQKKAMEENAKKAEADEKKNKKSKKKTGVKSREANGTGLR